MIELICHVRMTLGTPELRRWGAAVSPQGALSIFLRQTGSRLAEKSPQLAGFLTKLRTPSYRRHQHLHITAIEAFLMCWARVIGAVVAKAFPRNPQERGTRAKG
jgi:hypothetical protein